MGGKGTSRRKARGHQDHDCHGHDHGDESSLSNDDTSHDAAEMPDAAGSSHADGRIHRVRRRSPNAYEKMKTYKKSGGGGSKEGNDV